MKIKTKITALLASLTFLASCKESEEYGYHHTVGEENNAITLMAGISEGGAKLQTRAVDGNHAAGTNGGGHTLITTGAKMLLDVRGKWKKTESGTAEDVTKTTTITIGGASATEGNGTEHNSISNYNPVLYWDDYGTADPNNTTAGRAEGLTIYGVGVNKNGADVPSINGTDNGKKWTELYWSVGNPSGTPSTIDQSSDWTQYDLITSNNIRAGADGTLKFQEWKDKTNPSDILEFTHAMSKITVELTAADGFPTAGSPATPQFQTEPKVNLIGFNYIGKVDVETKTSTATKSDYSDGADVANIKMHRDGDATYNKANKVTYEAIVFPGNSWTSTNKSTSNILELNADGNIYKVTAEKLYDAINTAISSAHHPGTADGTLSLTQGWNYKLQITVKKTEIQVTATVENWKNVTADPAYPEIDVTMAPGSTGTENTSNAYSFFISTTKDNGYGISTGESPNTYYAENSELSYSSSAWGLTPKLYWPNHQTHYHMRGIYPSVGTTSDTGKPVVVESGSKQYVAVSNGAYDATTFPSNFMIGKPEIPNTDADKMCKSTSHTSLDMIQNGICATKGKINLNFRYMMSQVVVNLKTNPEAGAANIVNFGTKGQSSEAEVKILNGYTAGNVLLGSMEYDFTGKNKTDFPMTATTDVQRHNIVCAQSLEGLKFQVTIKNADGTIDDVYTIDIKDIKVKKDGESTSHIIESWEPGHKYVYELTITKTDIKVTATITPWTEVTANQPVWF